jgi:two-component system, OmpR family, sensor kinase
VTRARARRSLQWRLIVGLVAAIVLTGALAAVLSFAWALHDANEILDGTLQDTADMIATGQMAIPRQPAHLAGSEPENDVLVLPLGVPGVAPPAGMTSAVAGLHAGLHTVTWLGDSWRVLVTSTGSGRIAVAQRTQERDEIAQHSAIRTLIPLFLLVPVLTLLVREVVRRTLRPVAALARYVDSNPMGAAAGLRQADVPLEIAPFLDSIYRLIDELTQRLEQQRRFVANAAHELRSPVAALHLQAINLEPVVAAEGRGRLEQLRSGTDRMRRLLEQLLSLARSEADSTGLSSVFLAHVARELIADLVLPAETKGIDLGMDLDDEQASVLGTDLLLHTLIRNAVENAVKYSPPGSVVTVSVYRHEGDAVVTVDDDGPGIPASHADRVFEAFYRVPGASEPGSGLGLAIVAAIAKRLGGRASLQPRDGAQGMRFEYRQALATGDDPVAANAPMTKLNPAACGPVPDTRTR